MRLINFAVKVLATAATGVIVLFAGATAASASTAAQPTTDLRVVANASAVTLNPHGVEFAVKLTPAQLHQLRQAAAANGLVVPGSNFQGGFDRDHWWFKISKAEVISIGVAAVCRAVFGGASWFVCPPLTAAVNWAVSQFPNAGGFWGELYTNGTVRVGTW